MIYFLCQYISGSHSRLLKKLVTKKTFFSKPRELNTSTMTSEASVHPLGQEIGW